MQETINQHYIPRCYLKNFSDRKIEKIQGKEQHYITALNKTNKDEIFCPNIENICSEKHFYTLKGKSVKERQLIEDFYSNNIENEYDGIYKILTDESVKVITPQQRADIITTVITSYFRTPLWVNRMNENWDNVLDRAYTLMQQPGAKKNLQIEGGITISFEDKTLDEIKQDFKSDIKQTWIIEHLKHSFDLIASRLNDSICVNKIEGDLEFVSSDNPVLMTNMQLGHIVPFDQSNMIRLPLDPKHCLVIMPTDNTKSNSIYRRNLTGWHSELEIKALNQMQYESALRFVIGKKFGIESLLQNKAMLQKSIPKEEADKIFKQVKDIMDNLPKID